MGLTYANRKRPRAASVPKKDGPALVEVHRSLEVWTSIGDFLSLRLEQNKSYPGTLYRGKESEPVVCHATSFGACLTIDGIPRPWTEAPWDQITAFALADEDMQKVLVTSFTSSNGKDPFLSSGEESELNEDSGRTAAISRAISRAVKEAMQDVMSEWIVHRQILMAQMSSLESKVIALTPVSSSATTVPATGAALTGGAAVAQPSGAPTPERTSASAQKEKAVPAVPCFEIFNIATWPAHLRDLSVYDRKHFLKEQLMADEEKFVKLQTPYLEMLCSLVNAAVASPHLWNDTSIVRTIQKQVAPMYFFRNTRLRESSLRVRDFMEALERDRAFDKPDKFDATVRDLEPKKQVHTVTVPAGTRKNFPRASRRRGA